MNLNPRTPTPLEATPGQWLGRCGRLLLAALLLLPPNLWAATFNAGDETALRDAIAAANGNVEADTITLTADIALTATAPYPLTGTGGNNGLPLITSDITIDGAGFTISRDGVNQPPFRFFEVQNDGATVLGKLTLDSVTLDGGKAVASPFSAGGAVASFGGDLSLTNTTISGSDAYSGGGVYLKDATADLLGSTLSGNTARGGGGLYVGPGGTAMIEDSTVSGNSADFGGGGIGGMYYAGSSAGLINTTVTGNSASVGGGAYVGAHGGAMLTNSTVSANTANQGGGIAGAEYVVSGIGYCTNSTIVEATTISGNEATEGGGIYVGRNCSATLTNSTISGNTASNAGGGLFAWATGSASLLNSTMSGNSAYYGNSIFVNKDGGGNFQAAPAKVLLAGTGVTLKNSILGHISYGYYHCEATQGLSPVVTDDGGNLQDSFPGSCGDVPEGLNLLDPELKDNGGPTQTHALLCGSSAIDNAGDCGLATDQRGEPRNDGLCDSGSYEVQKAEVELYPIALSDQTVNLSAPPKIGAELLDIFNGSQPGNFGWLTWTGDPSVPVLAVSLTPPGDSDTYVNPYDPEDTSVWVGDYVQGTPGVSNASDIRDLLQTLIDTHREITVPIWDLAENSGSNTNYRVAGFARVEISSFHLPNDNRISAIFKGLVDTSTCP